MKLRLERSGGFAGLRLTADIDSTTLPEELSTALLLLVERSDFFGLPAVLPGSPNAADVYQYVLTIDGEGRSHSVTASEDAAPASLRALFDYVIRLARKRPNS